MIVTFLDTPPRQPEAHFQPQVIKLAELLGWRVRHDSATNQRRTCASCQQPLRCAVCGRELRIIRNAAGMLDLLLIRRPRVVWAEIKSDRGNLSPEQRAQLTELRACGQEAFVWRPKDFDTLTRILR